MTDFLPQLPGYRVSDYQIILNPHEDLRNRILNIKQEFGEHYNINLYKGKPHITLVRFKAWEMMEEKIINHLRLTAMSLPPFKLHLKDYGSFPTHTIHIKVESQIPIHQIQVALRSMKRLMKVPDHDPHFMNEPFIPVAQKLPPDIYEKAWPEYQHRHFTGHFIADNMMLLKKREGSLAFQIAERLPFMNLPISVKQGDLF